MVQHNKNKNLEYNSFNNNTNNNLESISLNSSTNNNSFNNKTNNYSLSSNELSPELDPSIDLNSRLALYKKNYNNKYNENKKIKYWINKLNRDKNNNKNNSKIIDIINLIIDLENITINNPNIIKKKFLVKILKESDNYEEFKIKLIDRSKNDIKNNNNNINKNINNNKYLLNILKKPNFTNKSKIIILINKKINKIKKFIYNGALTIIESCFMRGILNRSRDNFKLFKEEFTSCEKFKFEYCKNDNSTILSNSNRNILKIENWELKSLENKEDIDFFIKNLKKFSIIIENINNYFIPKDIFYNILVKKNNYNDFKEELLYIINTIDSYSNQKYILPNKLFGENDNNSRPSNYYLTAKNVTHNENENNNRLNTKVNQIQKKNTIKNKIGRTFSQIPETFSKIPETFSKIPKSFSNIFQKLNPKKNKTKFQ
jgi:hypothetical protein